MQNYLDLLRDIKENGIDKSDRTGVGSRAMFGKLLRWDLGEGFPILTTRRVSLRVAFEETLFFLRGETNTKLLEEKNVNIWKGNTTREFLDKRGLNHLPEGDMGHGYGYVWRHFKGPVVSSETIPNNVSWFPAFNSRGGTYEKETDQIKDLLEGIRQDPFGRRHVVTGWHPGELENTALPPCHMLHMYSVTPDKKLHSTFVMRSNDVYHGLPFNIMSYALLNEIFAKHLGLTSGDLIYMGHDAHIYNHQKNVVDQQLERTPRNLPRLVIKKQLPTLDSIMELQWEDIELIGYDPHPALEKVEMAI